MMVRLAEFASSDRGRFYAMVCERWGIDPAAGMGDDVVAYNLRAALMLGSVDRPPTFEEKYGGEA